MKLVAIIKQQIPSFQKIFILLQLPAIALLLFVALLKVLFDIPTGDLLRDPNAVSDMPLYTGMISNIGVLFWCATASICLFTAWLGRSDAGEARSFLLYAGALTLLLMLDDLFRIHDDLFPDILGISQAFILAGYGLFIAALIYRYFEFIQSTNFLVLLLSVVLFGMSLFTDLLLGNFTGKTFINDSAKFIGIITWFGYFVPICLGYLQNKVYHMEPI